MKKPVIILADPQEEYLEVLELLLLMECAGEIDLRVISEAELYQKMAETPIQADLLVVGEAWSGISLEGAQIGNRLILCENQKEEYVEEDGAAIRVSTVRMNRYANPKGIINTIISLSGTGGAGNSGTKRTIVAGVCSASGGSGCTTLAVSLAARLSLLHKKTLFLSFDDIPAYQLFLKNQSTLPADGYGIFRKKNLNWFYETRKYIRKETFDYFPPLPGTTQSLHIPDTLWPVFLGQAKDSNEYDFIVADLGKALNRNASDGIELCDRVIVAAMQDRMYAGKNAYMLHAMDFSDSEKFLYICNRFSPEKENYLISPIYHPVSMKGYVPEIEEAADLAKLLDNNEIREIAYLFI